MKHLFIVHSHTTFLSAIGVVNYLQLNESDVYLLVSRNYKNKLIKHSCNIVDFNEMTDYVWNIATMSVRERNKRIEEFDNYVDSFINGSDYYLYAPHFALVTSQLLYTNSHCILANYIQEGGTPFFNAYKKNFSLKERLRYYLWAFYRKTNRIWSAPGLLRLEALYKQKTIESYAISDTFFKYMPSHNNIIQWPSVEVGIKLLPKSNIFILDGYIKNGLCDKDIYMSKCKTMIKEYAKDVNYIKYHPAQSQDERKEINDFFVQSNIKFYVLEDEIPMELILSSSDSLEITGFGSSLLYFAQDLGHKVNCLDYYLYESSLYLKYKRGCGFMSFNETYNLKGNV